MKAILRESLEQIKLIYKAQLVSNVSTNNKYLLAKWAVSNYPSIMNINEKCNLKSNHKKIYTVVGVKKHLLPVYICIL